MFQLGKVYGIESYVLSPAETKDLYPLMNIDDLYGTLYVPKDGTMDPAGTCTTLSRAATARGATVICANLLTLFCCFLKKGYFFLYKNVNLQNHANTAEFQLFSRHMLAPFTKPQKMTTLRILD